MFFLINKCIIEVTSKHHRFGFTLSPGRKGKVLCSCTRSISNCPDQKWKLSHLTEQFSSFSAGISCTLHLCLWPWYLKPTKVNIICSRSYVSLIICRNSGTSLSTNVIFNPPSCDPRSLIVNIETHNPRLQSWQSISRPGAEEGVRFFFTPSLARLARQL